MQESHPYLKVTLKDLITGEVKDYPSTDISAFSWAENNWSCDCNRIIAFTGYVYDSDVPCKAERYLVIDAEGGFDGATKEEFIAECNYSYPEQVATTQEISND